MQCKDIPERPILELLFNQPLSEYGNREWMFWFTGDRSIQPAFPPGTPYKLVIAKMAQMIKKGLVDGCGCGCRGDYVITEKGIEVLNEGK